MTDYAYALRTAGYTVVTGVLEEHTVRDLAARLDELLTEDDASWGADRLNAIGQRGALRNLADRGAAFEQLLGTPVLHVIADALLGSNYCLHSYDGLVLQPDEGRFPWDFHTDLLALRGVAFPADMTPGINCLVAVDATGPTNGATWLVPGSHRSVVRNPDVNLLARLATQPPLNRGDVLLFDARIWHCAGTNHSAISRRLIKIELVQPWLRPQMEYARSVRLEVQSRLGSLARRALGTPPPASVEELWLMTEANR